MGNLTTGETGDTPEPNNKENITAEPAWVNRSINNRSFVVGKEKHNSGYKYYKCIPTNPANPTWSRNERQVCCRKTNTERKRREIFTYESNRISMYPFFLHPALAQRHHSRYKYTCTHLLSYATPIRTWNKWSLVIKRDMREGGWGRGGI